MNQLKALKIIKKLKPRKPVEEYVDDTLTATKPTGYVESDADWFDSNREALCELADAISSD